MSVTLTERKLDGRRRMTIPAEAVGLKEGSTVTIAASHDAVIIASEKAMAEQISNALREIERSRKLKALYEWQGLVEKSGLSNLSTEEIDRKVEGVIRRPKKIDV